ncbi:hypothetical protein KHA96_19835 [Bacillus sp. FJAT-49711]|uniref:DUF5986 family protein n=1 Tax=Bacillus sp. FJAT-49711 TaxID=2833585 RepID=UPI001BC9DE06|nr:DUF5986 family protein [Bacillus sp. FJAT-49711]MBS4220556.1 hypothetical protein [Bacillus sp. FJAT-49711]
MAIATDMEQIVIEGILHAMSITGKDVVDDFEEAISKSNKNGLHASVWARRSDDLEAQFSKFDEIEVFHIKRTSLWQIDPVFDRSNGVLYLLFSDINLSQVKNKYIKQGKNSHYSVSFLLKNIGLLPMEENEQLELVPIDDETIEELNNKRQKDIEKMIGKDATNIKKVKMVSVTYHEDEAIAALLQEYTSDFLLSSEWDISDLLDTQYFGDNIMSDNTSDSVESTQSLVTLKDITKTIDD